MSPNDTIRVFVALDIPSAAKELLAQTIKQLQQCIAGEVRWVDPRSIHLTLKFLGNVDSALVGDILAAMKQASVDFQGPRFQFKLSGLGLFPSNRLPRILWAGTAGDLRELTRLQQAADEAICRLGFPREKRPFQPHLTIGRVRDGVTPAARQGIGAAAMGVDVASTDFWEVDAMHLIESTLTPTGAVYTSLGSVFL